MSSNIPALTVRVAEIDNVNAAEFIEEINPYLHYYFNIKDLLTTLAPELKIVRLLNSLSSRASYEIISQDAEYLAEFNLLITALTDLKDSLAKHQNHVRQPLKEILLDSMELTYEIGRSTSDSALQATRKEKTIALKNTILLAIKVAENPFTLETNQALIESAFKMRDIIEGRNLFRKENQQFALNIVMASMVLVKIAMLAAGLTGYPVICLAISIYLLGADTIPQQDKSSKNIYQQATTLNKNCLFSREQQAKVEVSEDKAATRTPNR